MIRILIEIGEIWRISRMHIGVVGYFLENVFVLIVKVLCERMLHGQVSEKFIIHKSLSQVCQLTRRMLLLVAKNVLSYENVQHGIANKLQP